MKMRVLQLQPITRVEWGDGIYNLLIPLQPKVMQVLNVDLFSQISVSPANFLLHSVFLYNIRIRRYNPNSLVSKMRVSYLRVPLICVIISTVQRFWEQVTSFL